MQTRTDSSAGVGIPAVEPLEPPFRLPEKWYRKNMQRLQAKLQERGLDGIILEDVWNIIYFSGLFHSKTERPFWLFVPAHGEPAIFHPALDRDAGLFYQYQLTCVGNRYQHDHTAGVGPEGVFPLVTLVQTEIAAVVMTDFGF